MEKLTLTPREASKTTEGLLENPPQTILVFDYQGAEKAYEIMRLRAAVAASIYHSKLYPEGNRPRICCFAGAHKAGDKSGSAAVKEHLLACGIDPQDIFTDESTITTTTDITRLHAYMKVHHLEPAAIITTQWHIPRTEQELVNHFNAHRHHPQMPKIYIVGPFSGELTKLEYTEDKQEQADKLKQEIERFKTAVPSGGMTEEIAYLLSVSPSWLRRNLQPLAEFITHPYTPSQLKHIIKIYKKVFT